MYVKDEVKVIDDLSLLIFMYLFTLAYKIHWTTLGWITRTPCILSLYFHKNKIYYLNIYICLFNLDF